MQRPSETHDPLPTPRTFLTSLINAISAIPLTPASDPQPQSPQPSSPSSPPQQQPSSTPPPIPSAQNPNPKPNPKQAIKPNDEKDQPSSSSNNNNPLHRVPPASRPLITTLHALFPGLVLPALDLLERGFVARVSVDVEEGVGRLGGGVGVGGRKDGDEDQDGDGDDVGLAEVEVSTLAPVKAGGERDAVTSPSFYLVQSASAAEAARERWRRRRYGGGGADDGDGEETNGVIGTTEAKVYIVRLEAWHCTCAAFAFSSVQDGGDWGEEEQEGRVYGTVEEPDPANTDRLHGEWSFGGLSLDGIEPGLGMGVPVCKHLLACVLADRWREALGRYVVERKMRREEVAGIVADV